MYSVSYPYNSSILLSEYHNLMDGTIPVLKPSSTNLTVYNQTKLRSLGHATLTLTVGQQTSTLQFHVVPYAPCALLSVMLQVATNNLNIQ